MPWGSGAWTATTHQAAGWVGAGRTERRKGGLTRWHRHHVQSGCSRQPPACCTAPAACASPCHRRCSPPGLAQMPAAEAEAAIKWPCAVWSDSQFRTPLQIYLWMGPIIHGKVRTSRDVVGRKFKLLCALISVCSENSLPCSIFHHFSNLAVTGMISYYTSGRSE